MTPPVDPMEIFMPGLKKMEEEARITKEKLLSVSEGPFTYNEVNYSQIKYTRDGVHFESVSNFVLLNTRFVSGDRGLLADISVQGRPVKRGILFDKHSVGSLEFFRRVLPIEADITINPALFPEFVKFLKKPARQFPSVNIIDQTGLYKDEETGEYYFLIYNNKGELKRLTRKEAKPTADVHCLGTLASKTKARIKENQDSEKFQIDSRTILNEFPKMLADNKATIVIAWAFASLLSETYYEQNYNFVMLFLHGEHQAGKTTLAGIVARILGYRSSSDMLAFSSTAQPFKQAVSATNAFAVLTEEFVIVKSKEAQTIAFLKQVFNRDKLERGESNKQNSEYSLRAPLMLQGNKYISNEAVADRCLPVYMRKADRVMPQSDVAKLLRHDFSYFLGNYLPYLLEKQDLWIEWFQKAEETVQRADGDQRGYSAASAVVLGILMMNDLAEHVGANKVSPEAIQEIVKMVKNQRSLANPKEPYIRFLEFVQEKHTDEDFSRRKDTVLENGKMWIKKTSWIEEFLKEAAKNGQEISERDLEASLAEQPFVKGAGSAVLKSMYGKTVRCLEIDMVGLEKAVPSLPQNLWNDIRTTNSRLEAEQATRGLREHLEYESGFADGEKELMEKLKKMQYHLSEEQIQKMRLLGIELD